MPQLILLGLQITAVVPVRRHLDRHALDNVQVIAVQADHLLGIVRQKANLPDAEIDENLSTDAVMPQVRAKTKSLIGLDRIELLFLL